MRGSQRQASSESAVSIQPRHVLQAPAAVRAVQPEQPHVQLDAAPEHRQVAHASMDALMHSLHTPPTSPAAQLVRGQRLQPYAHCVCVGVRVYDAESLPEREPACILAHGAVLSDLMVGRTNIISEQSPLFYLCRIAASRASAMNQKKTSRTGWLRPRADIREGGAWEWAEFYPWLDRVSSARSAPTSDRGITRLTPSCPTV